MTTVVLKSRKTGKVIDRITLDDGELTYETGAARQVFEGPRAAHPDWTDEQVFGYFAPTDPALPGWSNGYLQVVSA